jgi:hypothetical protein
MGLLRTLVVLGMAALVVYVAVTTLMRGARRPAALQTGGRWQTAHYEVDGATRVVVRKVLPDGVTVVDEQLVATVPVDDPGYDASFLDAMARARERLALFEAEDG